MPRYDASEFDPPAPIAEVVLRDAVSGASVSNVILLIDTGADVTLLPESAIEKAGIPIVETSSYELIGFDGTKSVARAVDLDLIFLGKVFRGRYLLIRDNRGILGRDVLAGLAIILDGPRQEWLEHRPA